MIAFEQWLEATPVPLIGLITFLAMAGAAFVGSLARRRRQKAPSDDGKDGAAGPEGHVVTAVLGLLALLLGFTFALAVNRFETRRELVLQEANAIDTSYHYVQLLEEPHRSRLSGLLRAYTENRVALATAAPDRTAELLARNDRLLVDLWSATAAAFDGVKATAFSNSLLQVVSRVLDLDAARKAARHARVPTVVYLVLLIYVVVAAGMLGYVRVASRGVVAVGFLFVLKVMSLMLILDIDRPAGGGIRKSQGPMIALRDTLRTEPPGTFDRWRSPLPRRENR